MNLRSVKTITVASALLIFAACIGFTQGVQAKGSCAPVPCLSAQASDQQVILVALHGFGLNKEAYQAISEQMTARGISFESLDVRGFGKKANDQIDFEAAATEIAQHLKELRVRQPAHKLILVGESMGGALALKVATQAPGFVDGIIASEPAYKVKVNPIIYPELMLKLLTRPNSPSRIPLKFARQVTDSEPFLSELRNKLNSQRGYSVIELLRFRSLMKSTPGAIEKLSEIPVLFLQGDSDRLVAPSGTITLSRISSKVPHTLVVFKQKGHLLLEENQANEEILMAIEDWIATLPSVESFATLALQRHSEETP